MPRLLPPTLLLTSLIRLAAASKDDDRLGQYYTALTLWRSGAGTNIFQVAVGTPSVPVNLTVSTNVEFVLIAGEDCTGCVDDGNSYNNSGSASFNSDQLALLYTTIYPSGATDTLQFSASLGEDILADGRSDTNNQQPIAIVNAIRQNAQDEADIVNQPGDVSLVTGSGTTLSDGSSGFWGLGVYESQPQRSIIPSLIGVNDDGSPNNVTYYTVGFDIDQYVHGSDVQAGTLHWGGVPQGSYVGTFNWIDVNTTVAGSWGIPVEQIRISGTVISTSFGYGSLDPGFDSIFVPTQYAEQFYGKVSGAARDRQDTTRWNLPCDTNISMTVTINNHEYNVASSELVQPRDAAGSTCWGSLVAWANGSLPESLGEVRLGTPFLSGIYTALYYSADQQFVGIAGKPDSVNDLNVTSSNGHVNSKLAGILIGSLLAALFLVSILCYARNRNSFQSRWYRAVRRQHRYHTNAVIRAATVPPMMPPPMMGMHPPMLAPGMMPHIPYAGHPMYGGQPMMPGMMPGMAPNMYAPPPYQPPMQAQNTMAPTQQYNQQQIPQTMAAQPKPIYSPRQDQVQGVISGRGSLPMNAAPSSMPGPHVRSNLSHSAPAAQTISESIRGGRRQSGSGAHQQMAASMARANVPSELDDGGKNYDEWLRQYSGPGQDGQPYPKDRKTIMAASAPPAPGHMAPGMSSQGTGRSTRSVKSRIWDWGKKSRGEYSSVAPGESPRSKRQIWLGQRRGGEKGVMNGQGTRGEGEGEALDPTGPGGQWYS